MYRQARSLHEETRGDSQLAFSEEHYRGEIVRLRAALQEDLEGQIANDDRAGSPDAL